MSRGAGEWQASHEPAPLGVPLHIPLLGIHVAAKWGHQVQQRVLGGPAEERQQEGHTKARGALTLWAKSRLGTLCQAEPDPLSKPISAGRGSRSTPHLPYGPPSCYPVTLRTDWGAGWWNGSVRSGPKPQVFMGGKWGAEGSGPPAEDRLAGEGPDTAGTLPGAGETRGWGHNWPEVRPQAVRPPSHKASDELSLEPERGCGCMRGGSSPASVRGVQGGRGQRGEESATGEPGLTACTGAAMSRWTQTPGQSKPMCEAMKRPAQELGLLSRSWGDSRAHGDLSVPSSGGVGKGLHLRAFGAASPGLEWAPPCPLDHTSLSYRLPWWLQEGSDHVGRLRRGAPRTLHVG